LRCRPHRRERPVNLGLPKPKPGDIARTPLAARTACISLRQAASDRNSRSNHRKNDSHALSRRSTVSAHRSPTLPPGSSPKKLTPAQTTPPSKVAVSRRDGIAIGFLRQPIGSSYLAVTFLLLTTTCAGRQTRPCTTPAGATDPNLDHYSLSTTQEYILPLLKKAVAIQPVQSHMITPWSPPGWMKTSGIDAQAPNPDTKQPSSLRPEAYQPLANYLVKTVQGYQAAGCARLRALRCRTEPLYAPPPTAEPRCWPPSRQPSSTPLWVPPLAAAHLNTKVMVYDHNWDRPDYPNILKTPTTLRSRNQIAWHHYAGDPAVMTKESRRVVPQKDQWVTESSGGNWQRATSWRMTAVGADRRHPQLGQKLRALGACHRLRTVGPVCGRHAIPAAACSPSTPRPAKPSRKARSRLLCARSRQQVPAARRGPHRIRRACGKQV